MIQMYETGHFSLTRLIDDLGNGRKFFIPGFYHADVWDPIQIINLLETLLHGWPIGNILLAQIPHEGTAFEMHPLYCGGTSAIVGENGNFDAGHDIDQVLVLDGRKRLQSLLLAFCTACKGIVIDEYGVVRLFRRDACRLPLDHVRGSHPARIYVNISNLELAMEQEGDIQSLNYVSAEQNGVKPILEWCSALGMTQGERYSVTSQNINTVNQDHILLADIWDFTRNYIDEYSSEDNEDNIVFKDLSEYNVKELCSTRGIGYRPVLFEFFKHMTSLHKLSIPYTEICLPVPEDYMTQSDIDQYSRSLLSIAAKQN